MGTTTCIGVVIASGSMEGAGIHVMPAFGQGIGIANVAITICTGEHSATVLSVVGAGQTAGSRTPLGLSCTDVLPCP